VVTRNRASLCSTGTFFTTGSCSRIRLCKVGKRLERTNVLLPFNVYSLVSFCDKRIVGTLRTLEYHPEYVGLDCGKCGFSVLLCERRVHAHFCWWNSDNYLRNNFTKVHKPSPQHNDFSKPFHSTTLGGNNVGFHRNITLFVQSPVLCKAKNSISLINVN